MNFGTTVIIASLAMVLASCGFQLRGEYQLSPMLSPVFVESPHDAELKQQLLAQLRANRVLVSSELAEAASVLELGRAMKSRRVVSVDSEGRAREYEIRYRLQYTLEFEDDKGEKRSMSRSLDLSRDLLFDPESVLAISEEIASLHRNMQDDAAQIIMRQLQAVR